ncbi:hypothetical protein A2962_00120 [Candidatus Woesebacteria bacterium RIFCSPLOWO2_01_FULL_39_61]|uniref:Carbonic anhydrase n=1 Tax=Candidatus Woesebacteria bacterium RIFCSPHIGHO2_02_FULL_39_13 TaxID=1802505 RepID=A0A1F7Z284_9BACT|nr:MAG: hypothetical protein A2692_02535 [Candidatus Woesebacteria bacterium RIFCSPHIGHO2_01_FULL_39_95]OGM33692.1 MAG: hypothetical protein A3D01_06100 [Candidatus Woesebacteria bacterium RIFCSPHIGHO2_02_FULL_39_13]OGM38928.1 MAG: hypothetical protein A3E13_02250 [Candidatus Woesebacteria bacterium RIFCSPHIGHO2_12_FULL_40_20]OGM68140.1 MAG: hypothetical protein A2962_00120 [Candidatus Woesebacteria bacterium RIFCSPLOWO2_01_FULL_39_61]OGM73171.1 MAG: hypothetical protein A3H19_03250 [Candidatus
MGVEHHCEAVVVSCIDYRFQGYLKDFLYENLKDKTFDYIGFAGSTKDLDIIMGQIEISVRLHNIKRAVLIHHEDCGAYGAEGSLARHTQDLLKAKTEINEKFPSLNVDLYYLKLDGSFVDISASEPE